MPTHPAEIEAFRTWLPRGRLNQKRADAVALLERMRADLLQAAQRWVHGLHQAAAQVAFGALATEVGRHDLITDGRFRRRSEYADEEELPPPLGGSAERWWAPFILVE